MELKTLMQNLSRNIKPPNSNIQTKNTAKTEAVKIALEMFTDGEIVKGEVIDVNNLTAKILTQNGDEINGQMQTRGQLNIGEERQFLVKQDKNGNTAFSIVPEDEEVLTNNNLSKALQSEGLRADEKTLSLAKELINNNLPVNKDTMQAIYRGLALLSGDDDNLEKTLVLLKNDMSVNSKNTNILNSFISKELKALDNMNNIETAINNLEDSQLKDNIIKIFSNGNEKIMEKVEALQNTTEPTTLSNATKENSKIEEAIKQDSSVKNNESEKAQGSTLNKEQELVKLDNKLIYNDKDLKELDTKSKFENIEKLNIKFSPKDLDLKELDDFLNGTKAKINQALKELENSNVAGTKELVQQLTNAKDSIDFTSQLKNNLFLQLPLNINNHETNGELLVFNNKNSGKNKNKKATSVIVGLDTVNLGRFETYIKKEEKKVDLQFRLEDDRVINLVKANMDKLEELLLSKNLKIESIQFKKIESPFTLMSKEENEEEIKLNSMKVNIKM